MNNNKDFNPSDLDNSTLRKDIVKLFYTILTEVAGVSNHNLIRNSNVYVFKAEKIDPEFEFSWIDNSYQEAQQKFQLGYLFLDSKTDFALNIEDILPVEIWYRIFVYLNYSHDLINLF